MRIVLLFCFIAVISCSKEQIVHAPAGMSEQQNALKVSKDRARGLNELERKQIESWISKQNEKFYPMPLNYWVNIENLHQRNPRKSDEKITYMYEISDFFGTKIYEKPKGYQEVTLAKFPNDIKAVEDALRFLKSSEEATLLVPSVLAYGTYGDGDRITHDLPLIIKLKVLQ